MEIYVAYFLFVPSADGAEDWREAIDTIKKAIAGGGIIPTEVRADDLIIGFSREYRLYSKTYYSPRQAQRGIDELVRQYPCWSLQFVEIQVELPIEPGRSPHRGRYAQTRKYLNCLGRVMAGRSKDGRDFALSVVMAGPTISEVQAYLSAVLRREVEPVEYDEPKPPWWRRLRYLRA